MAGVGDRGGLRRGESPHADLIITAGSRGDVAPFTGLGRRLLDAGHEVTVAAHPSFAVLVGGCGLGHRPLPGDPQDLIRSWSRAASPQEVRALNRAYVDGLADGVAEAVADGTDLVLTAFAPAPLSHVVGEALGVPVIGTHLTPVLATREFPLPGAPGTDSPGPQGHRRRAAELAHRITAKDGAAPVLAHIEAAYGGWDRGPADPRPGAVSRATQPRVTPVPGRRPGPPGPSLRARPSRPIPPGPCDVAV
ncbi:glycosyltransferase, partial [Streptomyces sp. CB01881]|uniref:glycosyltransferase n=1 Tax=Streptomyces sp. CB01881 TaxID=2078691 RepID=UPI001F4FC2E7